jgi:PAS domain S-box-containing protein
VNSVSLIKIKSRTTIVLVCLLLSALWSSGAWLYEKQKFALRTRTLISQELARSDDQAKGVMVDLARSLKVMHGIPGTLTMDAGLIELLVRPKPVYDSPQQKTVALKQGSKLPGVMRANQLLARVKTNLSVDVVWLLDDNGDCIAASNVDQADSFVGSNYRERDYFASARVGTAGYQFAVGKVSKKPGLFFSSPVFSQGSQGKVIGAVVVKIDIAHLAEDIDLKGTFIIDDHGVVILAQDKRLEMMALPSGNIHSRPPAIKRSVYQREQFPLLHIDPWPDRRYLGLTRIEHAPVPYAVGKAKLVDEHLQVWVAAPVPELQALDEDFLRLYLLQAASGCLLLLTLAAGILYLQESGQTRQLLRRQRDQLNDAQRLAQTGSFSLDLASLQLQCSDQAREFFAADCPASGLTLDHLNSCVHPDDRERVQQGSLAGAKSGAGFHLDYRIINQQGELRHITSDAVTVRNEAGNPVALASTLKDVTEYQLMMQALQASENHMKRVINSCLIGIVQADADGHLRHVNQAFLNLTGYHSAQLESGELGWQDMTPPEFRSQDASALAELLETGSTLPFEKALICHDGRQVPVQIGLARLEGSHGEWVGFVLDLSERNRINHLQSEFIAIVSHELRTPLTAIRGSLAVLEAGVVGALPDKAMELVKVAHRNSKRLVHMVNDILDMEKLAAGKMKFNMRAVELVALVSGALEANAAYAESLNVRFVFNVFPETASIWGDPDRLIQVLTNLMSNAAKFSPAGEAVELRILAQNQAWRVEVSDRGPGIPQAFRSQIFGTFAQADNSATRQKGGTGLGLNITKTMVELMEGQIGFDTEEGVGSTFWIMFQAL